MASWKMAHLQSSQWPFTIYLVYRSIGTTDLKPWKRRVYFKILISEFKMGLTRAGPGQDWFNTQGFQGLGGTCIRNFCGAPVGESGQRSWCNVTAPFPVPEYASLIQMSILSTCRSLCTRSDRSALAVADKSLQEFHCCHSNRPCTWSGPSLAIQAARLVFRFANLSQHISVGEFGQTLQLSNPPATIKI